MDMEYEKNEAQSTNDTAVRGEFTPTRGSFNYEGAAKNGSAYFNDDAKRQNMAKAAPKAETFNVGDKVVHPVFGEGVVLGARPMSGDVLYEVAFDKVGTKKIMGNFAKMTKA